MTLIEASDQLAQHIIDNQDDYIESLGLAIMKFHESLSNDDTPAMALAFARQSTSDNVQKED